jgi:hypothetical protein
VSSTKNLTQKRQFWRDHLTQWQTLKISQLAYCREHGLCPDKFSYYKRTLVATQLTVNSNLTGFVRVQIPPEYQSPTPLTLHFDNGLRLSGIADDNLGLVKQLAQVLS